MASPIVASRFTEWTSGFESGDLWLVASNQFNPAPLNGGYSAFNTNMVPNLLLCDMTVNDNDGKTYLFSPSNQSLSNLTKIVEKFNQVWPTTKIYLANLSAQYYTSTETNFNVPCVQVNSNINYLITNRNAYCFQGMDERAWMPETGNCNGIIQPGTNYWLLGESGFTVTYNGTNYVYTTSWTNFIGVAGVTNYTTSGAGAVFTNSYDGTHYSPLGAVKAASAWHLVVGGQKPTYLAMVDSVYCYYNDVDSKVYLTRTTHGTNAVMQSTSVTFVPDALLTCSAYADSVKVFYNGSMVGSVASIPWIDINDTNSTSAGLFSTEAGTAFSFFSVSNSTSSLTAP